MRAIKEGFLASIGRYDKYQSIVPENVQRTVFVCKGNICRSALAACHMEKRGRRAASFGLECNNGDPANLTMSKVVAKQGLLLSGHKTTSVESFNFEKNDLLLAMEPSQAAQLEKMIDKSHDCQIALLGMFIKPPMPTIVDPYGKQERFFEETASLIFQATDNLIKILK